MNNEHNDQKKRDEELRERLELLKQYFKDGKIRIPNDSELIESLSAVSYDESGKIDVRTADSTVRAFALSIAGMHQREILKKSISLLEIQRYYFDFIKTNFGSYYKIMQERGWNPHVAATLLAKENYKKAIHEKHISELLEYITDFWQGTVDAATAHIEDLNALKCVFGGDFFPSYTENIASKHGIYADTIILPDPFLRSKNLFSQWNALDKIYYLFKHAFCILQYRQLVETDLDIPIIAILPDTVMFNEQEREYYYEISKIDAAIHGSRIFGRNFVNYDEFYNYTDSLDTSEKLFKKIKDKNRIVIDVDWQGSIEEQLDRYISSDHHNILKFNHPGRMIASLAFGRMTICNELLLRSRKYRGVPIVDAPTSWQYFIWKLEYDLKRHTKLNNITDTHVIKGLQSNAKYEMNWLCKIPPEALIEIRQAGALEEIRQILNNGINDIVSSDYLNFKETSQKVYDNFNSALQQHEYNLKQLSNKKWKFAGKDIGSWLAIGTLEITAAATGHPIFGISAIIANQFFDVPKIKDMPKSIKDILEEEKKLKRSPIGMIFQYKK